MPSPVVPDDFKQCISDPSSGLCANFTATLLKLPVLIWKLVNYLLDSSGNPTKAFTNQVMPTGSLIFSAVTLTTGTSFLLCDGSDVSQATYPDLFAALGTTYGTSTPGNFKLPDYRARFPVGIGTFASSGPVTVGTPGGEDKHQLTLAEMPSAQGDMGTGNTVWTREVGAGTTLLTSQAGNSDGIKAIPKGSDTPHNTLPPYLGVYIYIVT